jgi:hypothetical protein
LFNILHSISNQLFRTLSNREEHIRKSTLTLMGWLTEAARAGRDRLSLCWASLKRGRRHATIEVDDVDATAALALAACGSEERCLVWKLLLGSDSGKATIAKRAEFYGKAFFEEVPLFELDVNETLLQAAAEVFGPWYVSGFLV